MAVSTNSGGSLEFVGNGEVYRHFLVISNEVNSSRVLACTSDPGRQRTSSFVIFNNNNLSYFVGPDAFETAPQMILSGDRNLSTNERLMSGLLTLTNNSQVKWTKDLHVHAGNLGLADGSAQQVSDSGLLRQINSSTNLPERVAIP